jgi:hypothetical protein
VTGNQGQNVSHDRTGHQDYDSKKRSENRTARTGYPEQDRQNRIAKKGRPKKVSQKRTPRMDYQDGTARRVQLGQDF